LDPALAKSGVILLIGRRPSAQFLCWILSAVLVWPTYVPWVVAESSSSGPVASPARVFQRIGGLHSRDRKAWLEESSWSDLADNIEGSDFRDDFPASPLDFGFVSMDFPNLVPSTLDARSRCSFDRPLFFVLSPPLRC
jgi:hypothetical protein